MNETRLTFKLLIILFTLSACGGGSKKAPTLFSSQSALVSEVDLTRDERIIATRVCYAYQTKLSTFQAAPFLGGNYQFSVSNTDCSKNLSQYESSTTLRYNFNNILEFYTPQSTTALMYSTVQTASTGYLSQLCEKIRTNQPISNTFTANGLKVQVSFTRTDSDNYTLRYFTQGATPDKFVADMEENFKVRTLFNYTSTEQILGMDEVVTRRKVCPTNLSMSSSYVQTFKKLVK